MRLRSICFPGILLVLITGCNISNEEEPLSDTFSKLEISDISSAKESYLDDGMQWIIPKTVFRTLDSTGVPVVNYSFGSYRNPVTTAQTAVAFHQNYLRTNSDNDRDSFLVNADWLLTNMDANGYFHYEFEWQHADHVLEPGWTSGMAQGEALSVLSIAYNITQDDRYLNGAERVFSTFFDQTSPYKFVVIEDAYLYLEEYPNPDNCHVLNGLIFGAWGLWDYYVVTGSEDSLDLFLGVLKTIYDNAGDWYLDTNKTKYCLHDFYIESYHGIHLQQLNALYDLSGNSEFLEVINLYSN